jgi:6-phosphogluconolactonase/glucosamine-6-phosphate isomerase/deaminase
MLNFELKNTMSTEDAAVFLAASVLKQLKLSKHVLLFVTGGSSIYVGAKITRILKEYPDKNLFKNLTITLTDERYGPIGHVDSNWQQLLDKGFDLPQAKLVPVLMDSDKETTIKNFNKILNEELTIAKDNEYKIGLFGVGADGHTAGILPSSVAVNSTDLACIYDTPTFSRITITPKIIERLDEAVVWIQGKDKWPVVENLLKENIPIDKQPAQVLKKVPLLTIFSDYIN